MISVIIPSYRPGDYIWKCLDSLNNQTLPKEEFEVFIVLNGCNEPYYEMLADGTNRYNGLLIKLIQVDEGGVSNARNIGLDSAKGEYIAFIDDDDWVSPIYLEDMQERVKKNSIVASNEIDWDEDSNTESDSYITRAFRRCMSYGHVSLFRGRSFMSSSCCKLIPRDLIGKKRYDTQFKLSEDSLFMTSISSSVESIIIASEDCIYYRRIRHTSSSHRISRRERLFQSVRVVLANLKLYCSDIPHNNLPFYLSRIFAAMIKGFKKTWI